MPAGTIFPPPLEGASVKLAPLHASTILSLMIGLGVTSKNKLKGTLAQAPFVAVMV